MDVLIIGCGSIGSTLAKSLDSMPEISRILVSDKSRDQSRLLVSELGKGVAVEGDDHSVMSAAEEVDLVIESASQEAARHFVPKVLALGRDMMVMSAGAFTDDNLRAKAFRLAKERGGRLMIPSGAVTGTDGIHSAAAGTISEVSLVTTKGPRSLRGNPYLIAKGMDVDRLRGPTTIFEGNAREAADLFPRSLNVAATIALLGLGFEGTKVTIVCDPAAERNTHMVTVRGPFGEMRTETQNVPSPMNPSTSFLACLSAVAAIRRIIDNVWIGI